MESEAAKATSRSLSIVAVARPDLFVAKDFTSRAYDACITVQDEERIHPSVGALAASSAGRAMCRSTCGVTEQGGSDNYRAPERHVRRQRVVALP